MRCGLRGGKLQASPQGDRTYRPISLDRRDSPAGAYASDNPKPSESPNGSDPPKIALTRNDRERDTSKLTPRSKSIPRSVSLSSRLGPPQSVQMSNETRGWM